MVLSELRKQFETADESRKLPLAYALAHFGDVRVDFLVSHVETASPDEVDNFIAALGTSNSEAVASLEATARTAGTEENWQYKSRLAMLALHLNASSLAQDMCHLRPDPVQRSWFIEECSTWHGDLSALVQPIIKSFLRTPYSSRQETRFHKLQFRGSVTKQAEFGFESFKL